MEHHIGIYFYQLLDTIRMLTYINKYKEMRKIALFKKRGQIGNKQIVMITESINHIQSLLSFIVIVHT